MKWDAEVEAAVTLARKLYAHVPEPALVHAVIERETHHGSYPAAGTLEPNGRRSYGPMQVEDSTAEMHGVGDPSTLSIPSLGIRIGTLELSRLMGLFPGDTARAVAGYNAGAGNAVRSRSTGRFPNQPYVDAVLNYWRLFRTAVVAAAPTVAVAALMVGLLLLAKRRRRVAA